MNIKSTTATIFTWFILLCATISAQSNVTLTINTKILGAMIPKYFNGVSFGTRSLMKGAKGYFFDSNNSQILMLFKELGIRNLRLGGTSVDTNNVGYIPSRPDIDALFRFAKAANIKIIYSLKLLNGDSLQDASTAKYIWKNYRQYLECFAIGNEPNLYKNKDPEITGYSTYISKWRRFAKAITDSIPDAKFGGPDNDTGGTIWGTNFAHDELGSGIVVSIFFHYYVGGGSYGKTIQQIIDEVLSPSWDTKNYPTRYSASGAVVSSMGFPYRLTESNSYYTGHGSIGVWGGNNCFATALFALDYMHWWAEHGCMGVNFHTTMWKYNATFYKDPYGNYKIYPMGYGIKAFDLGGHGRMEPVTISNPDNLNLTAYAVEDTNAMNITIINKEHDEGARSAKVNILAAGYSDSAAVILLQAPNNNPASMNGITLGGAPVSDNIYWQGKWLPINSIDIKTGSYKVTVPVSTAAIVRIYDKTTSVSGSLIRPKKFILKQNYPNPFNPSTVIKYAIPESGFVSLNVYNVLGQKVITLFNGYKKVGFYKIEFNASKLASGDYLYRLQSGGLSITKKMILMK